MIKTIPILLAILIHSICLGQKIDNEAAKSILNRISNNYIIDNYSLKYTKSIFGSIEDKAPMEISVGTFYVGNKNEYKLAENGTLIVQNNELNMTIDSASNMIYLSEIDKDYIPLNLTKFMSDSLMNTYQFSLIKKGKIHELIIENKLELSYSILIQFDAISYLVTQFIYHLPTGNYFSETLDDETQESPVMLIVYDKLKKEKFNSEFFSQEKWILKDKNPIELQEGMTQFEIYDFRAKSHLN